MRELEELLSTLTPPPRLSVEVRLYRGERPNGSLPAEHVVVRSRLTNFRAISRAGAGLAQAIALLTEVHGVLPVILRPALTTLFLSAEIRVGELRVVWTLRDFCDQQPHTAIRVICSRDTNLYAAPEHVQRSSADIRGHWPTHEELVAPVQCALAGLRDIGVVIP